MAFADPQTTHNPGAGLVIPSAWGDAVRAAIMAIYGRPRVFSYRSFNLGISHDTLTPVTFDAELEDSHGMHSTVTNTSRLTVPSGWEGNYILSASVGWGANVTGLRYCAIVINGAIIFAEDERPPVPGSGECVHNIVLQSGSAPGDFFEVYVRQTSGGTLSIASSGYIPRFSAVQVTGTNVG